MIRRMEETGPRLSAQDIERVENRMGTRLPDEYKSFLLRYNGGRPRPNAYPIEGLANNPFGVIQVFLRIDGAVESSNLDWNYEVMKGRISWNLLPIACDGCGDLICLSLGGADVGAVLFWDRHTEPATPSYENVYRVAASFKEFLDGLRELPE